NGVTTHAFDNCQRLVDLDIAGQAGGTITARVPAQSTLAPPGWYMLFLVDTAGVPSVSSWVHLR
ncbi:MAG TPA: galactose oxidase early set domain-containing protein, partial [Dermatophilaceae bacterium]